MMYGSLSTLYYQNSKKVGQSLGGDLEFYLSQLKKGERVLEAGVGTGRLLIPMLQAGLTVDGIDLSAEMLGVCRENCVEAGVEPLLIQGDLVEISFDALYDKIIIPTGTFCLFNDIEAVLKNLSDSLVEGGTLIFDILYPTHIEVGKTFEDRLDLEDGSYIELKNYHKDLHFNYIRSVESLEYTHIKDGVELGSEREELVLNYYDFSEIRYMLDRHGFKDIKLLKDYQDEVTVYDHEALITVVAVKG
ncbi:class I SAM-dependent methyltransferase [Erysipelothrix urinaevulpis]|nr:class I SAM-dependent methyltransferase [Erysipelothrix urinaevulpis]